MCRFRHLYDAELNGEYGQQDDLRDITLSATDLAMPKVTGQWLMHLFDIKNVHR